MSDPTSSGTFLVSSLPPTSLGGIDLLSFTPGPNFLGLKLLPQGFHFFFTSPTSSLTLRHGLWFYIRPPPYSEPETIVAKWDPNQEHLVPETESSALLRYRANLGSIWQRKLLSYRQRSAEDSKSRSESTIFEERGDWPVLTSHITANLLSRVLGSRPEGQWGWDITSASSAKRDADDIPGVKSGHGSAQEKELNFLPIDLKQTWRLGATGRERTNAALDKSWALSEIQKQCNDKMEILGELEFSFLMVPTLGNYSCLEQWKRLLELLFTCKQAVKEQPDLFVETIRILKVQLLHCDDADDSLFDIHEDGGGFIRGLLRKFRKGLDDITGSSKSDVIDELEELEEFLKEEFDWEINESFVRKGMLELEDGEQVEMEVSGYDEDDESGEYAPTVVELTSEQRRLLGEPEEDINATEEHRETISTDSDEDEDDRGLEDMDIRY